MSSNETAASLPTTPIPRAAPRAAPRTAPVQAVAVTPSTFKLGKIVRGGGHRIVLYGTGGIRKSTLCAYAPSPVVFFDLDRSLPRLHDRWADLGLIDRVAVVDGVDTWKAMIDAIRRPELAVAKTIVIDTATVAEELCAAEVLRIVPSDKGSVATRIEDYGYGKGYSFIFDEWCKLLGELDRLAQRGQNVVLVCHDCSSTFANPMGGDFLRFEPRLQTSSTGKASVRLRTKEWADHVIWIGYDVEAGRDKKGKGSGTATLYFNERPWAMAKSRTLVDEMPMDDAFGEFWQKLTGDNSDSV